MSRRKGGRSQGETRRGEPQFRAPRVHQPPELWTRGAKTFHVGRMAKVKMVEIEAGRWKIIHVYFLVNKNDEYQEKDELIQLELREVRK